MVNDDLQPIVIEIDDSSAQAAVKRANASMEDYRTRAIRANADVSTSWARQAAAIEAANNKNRSGFDKTIEGVERIGHGIERAGSSVVHGIERGATVALEMAAAIKIVTLALHAQLGEVSALQAGFGGLQNTVRGTEVGLATLRGGLGAAVDVGTAIAAIAAVEKIIQTTYDRGRLLEQQALEAQRSQLAYPQVAALNFAAGRAGQAPDFFDQAAKAAGGVDQFAQKLRALGEIQDPVLRTKAAFDAFGDDAGKLLPFLNDRFADNIQRVNEWGLAFSQVDRERIGTFKRDIDSLRESLAGIGDTMSAFSKGVGNDFARSFGAIYSVIKGLAEQTAAAGTGIIALINGIGRFTGAPQIALTQEPFDVAAAARARRQETGVTVEQQSEQFLYQNAQRLAPAGTAAFIKSRGDQEDALKARVDELQKKLFVSDVTSPQFGKLVSGAQYPGGYQAEALAVEEYVSKSKRIEQIDAEKEAQKELAAAQKAVAAQLQAAELSELQGGDKLRAERDIELRQYSKFKDVLGDVNKLFEIRFRLEGQRIIDQSHADLVNRAQAEAKSQEDLLAARTQYTVGAVLETNRIRQQGFERGGQLELQQAAAQRNSSLLAVEAQTAQLPSPDRESGRDFQAQLLAQKLSLESRKLGVEQTFLEKARDLQLAGLQTEYAKQLDQARVLADAKLISQQAFLERQAALDSNFELERQSLALRTENEIGDARVRAEIEANRLINEHNQKLADEAQRQFESIAKPAESLFHTLFTEPSKFGSELSSTLKNAAFKPVEQGLGNVVAKTLYPTIYGQNGQGGIAGGFKSIFGGAETDPIKLATDLNTQRTVENTLALANATAVWAHSSPRPTLAPQGGQSQPGIMPLEALAQFVPHFAGGTIATQATIGQFGEAGPEAIIPLSGNWIANLEKLIGYQGGGRWGTNADHMGGAQSTSGQIGGAQSTSPWKAIAESPAAAIGTAAFAATAAERLSNPEWRKAQHYVKLIYHRDISHREAQHIAEIADQQYHHDVNQAVRSQEVRDFLGMWAPPPQQHFQGGGIIEETGPAIVHAGEAVLPTWLMATLQAASNQVQTNAPGLQGSPLVEAIEANTAALKGLTLALPAKTAAQQDLIPAYLRGAAPAAAPAAAPMEPRNLVTKVGGFPIDFAPTDLEDGGTGSYGDFDTKKNLITLYREGIERAHGGSSAAQVLEHETVHGLLKDRSFGQVQDLTGILGDKFVDQASSGIENVYGYHAAQALEEVIPRLVSGESMSAMGINPSQRQALLKQLYSGMGAHGDQALAQQFQQLSSARDLSDLVTTGKMHDLAPIAPEGNAYSDVASLPTLPGIPSIPSIPSFNFPASIARAANAVPVAPVSPQMTAEQLSAIPLNLYASTAATAAQVAAPSASTAPLSFYGEDLASVAAISPVAGPQAGIPSQQPYQRQQPSLVQRILGGGFGSPGGLFGMSPTSLPGMNENWGGSQAGILGGGQSPGGLFGGLLGGGGGPGGGGGFQSLFGGFGQLFGSKTLGGIEGNIGDWLHPGNVGLPGVGGAAGTTGTFGSTLSALSTGPFAGTAAAGLGGLGIGIAANGLLGNARGTGAGIAEGAVGGFIAAGPVGAAIGAGIGIGEMLAGVESPQRKAIREVKQVYHITISKSTADQIAQIAAQKYAGNIAVTIRDPQVRQMLELYSAATGQFKNFPQSATTPHGASLAESGGRLYQQATSIYGNQYTYASNLPTLGGGGTTGIYPNPGVPVTPGVGSAPSAQALMGSASAGAGGGSAAPALTVSHLSLNVGEQSAADLLEGRIAKTVDSGYVADSFSEAMDSSMGRLDTSAYVQQPNIIIS